MAKRVSKVSALQSDIRRLRKLAKSNADVIAMLEKVRLELKTDKEHLERRIRFSQANSRLHSCIAEAYERWASDVDPLLALALQRQGIVDGNGFSASDGSSTSSSISTSEEEILDSAEHYS